MSDNFPVKFNAQFNAKLDATPAVTETAHGIVSGSGRIFECVFGKRTASVRADAQRKQAQADADSVLIRYGLAQYKNGKMEYIGTPQQCSQLLIELQNERKRENLAKCLEEADKAIVADSTFTENDIDDDFFNRWQEKAEKCTKGYMQRIFGRILKCEIQTPSLFSLRSLDILSNMSQKEAEIFSSISRFTINDMFVISANDKIINQNTMSILQDAGLVNYAIHSNSEYPINKDEIILKNFDYCIHGYLKSKVANFIISGYPLSQTGGILLHILDSEKILQQHIQAIFTCLKKDNPDLVKIVVHPLDSSGEHPILSTILYQYPEE